MHGKDTSVPQNLRLALRNAKRYHEYPFETEVWKLWKETVTLPNSPDVDSKMLKLRKAESDLSSELFDELFAESPQDLKAKQTVWNTWSADQRQYDPRHLHKQLDTAISYKQWQRTRKLPDLLTLREYWFLCEYLNSTGNPVARINPYNCRHPVEPGLAKRAFKSKIGNIYGNWQLSGLSSNSERDKPVYYQATCLECMHKVERFAYTRVGQPCGMCKRLWKEVRLKDVGEPPAIPITKTLFTSIWQTPTGWVAQVEPPKNAIAKLVITGTSKEVHLERLDTGELLTPGAYTGEDGKKRSFGSSVSEISKADPGKFFKSLINEIELPDPYQGDRPGKVAEHEPAREPTAFEKTFSDLDVPEFDSTPRTTPWHNPHAEPAPEKPPKSDKPTLVELLMRPITAEEMRTGKNNWSLED